MTRCSSIQPGVIGPVHSMGNTVLVVLATLLILRVLRYVIEIVREWM